MRKEEINLGSKKYLDFQVRNELYGIPIEYVTEIVGIQPISNIPKVPEYMKGIINLRGKIIPIVDMGLKLNKNAAEYTDRTCIIVVSINNSNIGLIVDSISEVLNIADEQIEPINNLKFTDTNGYLSGIAKLGDKVSLVLNYTKLFCNEDLKITEQCI